MNRNETEAGGFESRLLASLTAVDDARPKASPAVEPAPSTARTFGLRPARLMRPMLLGLTGALVLAGAVVAAAVVAPLVFEPSGQPQLAGDQLAAKGSGCAANSTVTISLDGRVIGTVQAADTGDFSASVTIPAETRPGLHETTASCTAADGKPVVQTATIKVVAERPPLGPVVNANLIEAAPGDSLTLNIGPVKAGTDVAIALDGKPYTTAHATADGWLVVPVQLPADTTGGTHSFRATGVVPDGRAFDQTTELEVRAK